ncbi:discoidin domain-containing protein [Streptomyces griseosporeus]
MHPLLRRLGLSAVVAALLLTFVSLPAPRAHAAETLLSQGRPVAASSTEEPFSAQGAVDGNPSTRWSSAFSDPQWIRVDLGAPPRSPA